MSVASLPPTPTVSPALPLHRNLRVAIVTCATIALLIVLTRYWPIVQGALHEISLHPTVLFAGPLLALCFIACKGASLTAACHAAIVASAGACQACAPNNAASHATHSCHAHHACRHGV